MVPWWNLAPDEMDPWWNGPLMKWSLDEFMLQNKIEATDSETRWFLPFLPFHPIWWFAVNLFGANLVPVCTEHSASRFNLGQKRGIIWTESVLTSMSVYHWYDLVHNSHNSTLAKCILSGLTWDRLAKCTVTFEPL